MSVANSKVDEAKVLALKKGKQRRRNEARIRHMERLFVQKRLDMLRIRLESKPVGKAFKYSILGNEYKLKQELEFGHDVDERDMTSGRTILHEAVAAGHFHIVRMLLNSFSPDLSIPTLLGKATALHIAVEKGYRQITSILLTFGADINAIDKRGCTPLHNINKLSILKLIFKTKIADACIRSKEGLTAYSHYLKYVPKLEQNRELIEMLAEREDARAMERAKEQAIEAKMLREKFINQLSAIISSDSTLAENYLTRGKKLKNTYAKFSKTLDNEFND
jgi:ankyrin repeat protein